MRRAVSGLAFLACMSVCTIATAQEFTPTVSVWAGHTDNPFAIYHPPEDAYYSDLNAGFGYLKQTTRSKIEADLRVVRRDYYGADMPLNSALYYEKALAALVFESEDKNEGCRAFLEKRAPTFTGR